MGRKGEAGAENWGLCTFDMDQGDWGALGPHLPSGRRGSLWPHPHAQNCSL